MQAITLFEVEISIIFLKLNCNIKIYKSNKKKQITNIKIYCLQRMNVYGYI